MSERLIFRYPTAMATDWAARMVLAMGFWMGTAVYAILHFTLARGLLLIAAGAVAVPAVIYGVYSLLLVTMTVTLGETAVSIHGPLHHHRVPYGEIRSVRRKWGLLLLQTGSGTVRINGRLSHHLHFLHTLRQRSPHLADMPATVQLSISPNYLSINVFSAIILLVSGIGSLILAATSDSLGTTLTLGTAGIVMLVLEGFLIRSLVLTMLLSVHFSREQIVWRTPFHHRDYDATQLGEIRLETVYYTYKNRRLSRLELSLTFKNGEELRIQQAWVAQEFPDFLLLLDDLYPIAPTKTKSAEIIAHNRFGTGSDWPFSTYFEQKSGVQINGVDDIEAWLKKCSYVSDPEQFEKEDHWMHPVEFEATRKGDCEDHALWAWRKLVDLGLRAEFVTGHHHAEGKDHETLPPVNHAWVTFWENGRLYLMETTSKSDLKRPFASTTRTHQPRFSVNETFATFRHDLPKKELEH